MAESNSRICDRDDDDAPSAEAYPPGVSLDCNPATASGVLDDVLADLRQRHRESHGDLCVEVQVFYQCLLRPLLDLVHDLVNVVTFRDRSDFKKYASLGGLGGLDATLNFV